MPAYKIKCTNGNHWNTTMHANHLEAIGYFVGRTYTRELDCCAEIGDTVQAVYQLGSVLDSAVYRVQCFTFQLWRRMQGDTSSALVTQGTPSLYSLRTARAHRSPEVQAYRAKLAQRLRILRAR